MICLKYLLLFIILSSLSGCGVLQFSPGQVKKQNAWLLHETAKAAASCACETQADQTLQQLTALTVKQSESVVLDYGVPEKLPSSDLDSLLSSQTSDIAQQALGKTQSQNTLTDLLINILLVLLSLFGGAAGTQYLSAVKNKKAST